MAAVMVERDAVMAAVRGLIGDALEGRGGALFVAGEAGLGKTTVLEHAATIARGRFKTGIGRADVAEAALPFGLISQALEALLDGPAWLTDPADRGSAPAPADYFYAVLARLRVAAAEPLFLALDDAHWADPDSLTLLRLICRRIAAMPVAVLVTARPWPPEALRAGEELAARQLAAVQHLAPLSQEAARTILSQQAGPADPGTGELERAAALCAGNPLLLDYVAAAIRAGQGIPERQSPAGTSWARRLLLSHLAGLSGPAQRYLRAAAVLGRRFRPEVAAQLAGLAAADAAAAQEALAAAGLGRDAGEGWAEFSHELVRQAVYELAAPVRAQLHEAAFRVLAARGVNPAEAAGHAVAARLAGDREALDVVARAGREALHAGALGAARRHLQAAVDMAGPPVPAELVFDLGRALIAGGDHAAGVARYEELLARAGLPGETRLAILGQLSQARMYAGRIAEAEAAMEEAQRLAGPGRRDLTAGAMVDHAAQVMVTYGWIRAGPLAVRARELAVEASAPVRAAAAAVWAVGTYFSGDPAGLEVAEAAARSAATAPSWRPAGTPWWDPVAHYASLALSAERFGDARRLLDSILEAAERRSDPMAVAQALLYRTTLRWRLGQLDEGLALSARLLEAADLVPVMTPNAAAGRALILLDLGRLDEAEDWCARADEAAAGRGDSLGYAVMASHLPRGTLALRRGDLTVRAPRSPRCGRSRMRWRCAIRARSRGRPTRSPPTWPAAVRPTPGGSSTGWRRPLGPCPPVGRRSSWRRAGRRWPSATATRKQRAAATPRRSPSRRRCPSSSRGPRCSPITARSCTARATPARPGRRSPRRCGWPRAAAPAGTPSGPGWNGAAQAGAPGPPRQASSPPRRPRWPAWPGPGRPTGRSPRSCT